MSTHGGDGRARRGSAAVAERGKRYGSAAPRTTVTYTDERARAHMAARMGRQLSDAEIAGLGGAQPGSTITVEPHGEIHVTGPRGSYRSTVMVTQPDGEGHMLMLGPYQSRTGSNKINISPQVLRTQVETARRLGFTEIHMKARPGSRDYELLPRMGFDATIQHALVESRSHSLPAGVGRPRMLSDLLDTRAGVRWWHANGLNPGLIFDLRPGSKSLRTLNAYLRAHG